MKQSCVSRVIARLTGSFALAAALVGIGASGLAAQGATGKLEGTVKDQNQQPIPGARVLVVGTSFVGTADANGYYFIINVPAGSHNVRASFVGHQPHEVTGVRIVSGQTGTLDFTLPTSTAVLQDIVVSDAKNALVPRDQVTSRQIVDGDFAKGLPIDRMEKLFSLVPGVSSNSTGGSLSVRGSRTDENNVYVDGVSVTPGNRGTGTGGSPGQLGISVNAFEDASITTGANSAEFGNAQGGVISITTRTGGQRYSGSFAWETDEFSGLSRSAGYNQFAASFGGPITRNLTFYVGGQIDGTFYGTGGYLGEMIPSWVNIGLDTMYQVAASTSATADSLYSPVYQYALYRGDCDAWYAAGSSNPDIANNYGKPCRGNRGVGSPSSTTQLTSKLNWTFGQGSRASLSYMAQRGQSRGQRGVDRTGGTRTSSQVVIANVNQVLSRSASRQMSLDAYFSYQRNDYIAAPLTVESEESTRNPFLGLMLGNFDFEYGFDEFPVTDEMIRNFRMQNPSARVTIYDPRNTSQYSGQGSWGGPPGVPLGGASGGGGSAAGTLSTSQESRMMGKANIDWQVDRYNRMKFGGEYTQTEMDIYTPGATSFAFSNILKASPVKYSLFAEDRLDLGDVVLVGGLRYDYFDIGATRWKDFPRFSSYPDFTPDMLDDLVTPYQSHDYISPHIQVGFPVTERTNFRLSYGQMVQVPDYSVALNGANTDLAITNTNQNYGTDLDFGKSIMFEFGVRHAFSEDMVLDVSVYNKDNLANASGRLIPRLDPRINNNVDLRLTVNQDFGNSRGIDVRIDRRIGRMFNGMVAYSFMDAKNTGSDPYTYINNGSRLISAVTGSNAPPPNAAQPIGSSRPHNLKGMFSVNFPADFKQGSIFGAILGRTSFNGTAFYQSGTPYTRCDPLDQRDIGVVNGGNCTTLISGFNSARLPALKGMDLRVTKMLDIAGFEVQAYADIRNVLNIHNLTTVFAQTGGDKPNPQLKINGWLTDSLGNRALAMANGRYDNTTAAVTLPGSDAQCVGWVTTGSIPNPAQCYYWRKAEQRFGNGDGVISLDEQKAMSDLSRLSTFYRGRFWSGQRTFRLGMEVNF